MKSYLNRTSIKAIDRALHGHSQKFSSQIPRESAGFKVAQSENFGLERYKIKLGYRKFISGSVIASITIAAIPPIFQLATSVLESYRKEGELNYSKETFHDTYIKDFLDKGGSSVDIETARP